MLDRMLIINRHHLIAVLIEYVAHFNHHRLHRVLSQAAPLRPLPPSAASSQFCIRRRARLDGSIHEYTGSHDVDDQFGPRRGTAAQIYEPGGNLAVGHR
ncbi:MAG: hypothetical protein M3300_01690 [Actinomycetota bacterium]|nr:hypothetical protein [Actinomycetota bacterium]